MKGLLSILFLGTALFTRASSPLKIERLTENAYVYTTYRNLDGYTFPSNSMYVVTPTGVVLIDTPWDTTQFQPLLDSIRARHQQPVVLCIATHFHDDRTAGLTYFSGQGIPTWSSSLTYRLGTEHGENTALHRFVNDTVFNIGGLTFETYYPGPGHTEDNIVIWIPQLRILYGGCFVKSTEVTGLGNIADADIAGWVDGIRSTRQKFAGFDYLVPGHYGWSNRNGLSHTAKLLRKHIKNQK